MDTRIVGGTYNGSDQHCINVDWPAAYTFSARQYRRGYDGPNSWMGSLIYESRDASGLYYRRNRYYDSDKGRFTQEDPIGLAGGVNVYGFADGDPISYGDPYGLCPDPLARGLGSLQCLWEDFKAGAARAGSDALHATLNAIDKHGVDAIFLGAGILERSEASTVRGLLGRGAAEGAEGYVAKDFATGQLENHFSKHAAEWGAGNITQGGYLTRARQLLSSDLGRDIDGFTRANGDIVRYNIKTNEFAIGAADGTIRTLFRPTRGVQYYLEQLAKK